MWFNYAGRPFNFQLWRSTAHPTDLTSNLVLRILPLVEIEKHIALVCNPTATNARALDVTDKISVLLSGMDIRHSIFTAYWPQQWEGITEAWIIGGDGTVNWFINQYPHIHLPLSVFAGGTGNDFHWMLYGTIPVEQQVEQLLEGKAVPIDAGLCNDRLFLNGVGIGFDGAIVKQLLGKKKRPGKTSYFIAVLKNILGYREITCSLQLSKATIVQDCLMISVANARRYGGGFHVAPKALLTDGLLDVNIVGKISPLKRLRYLPVIEKGKHLDLPFIRYEQLPSIRVTATTALPAHMDGEFFEEKEFVFSILPKRFSFLL
jgi:YegS/Rv2252/BmrU family lipid kinase